MQFKNVEKAHVPSGATTHVEFPEIEGVTLEDGTYVVPWLEIKPAGEMNRPYMNAVLKRIAQHPASRGKLTVEDSGRERADSYQPYADHVLTGQGGGWVSAETSLPVPMPLSAEDRLSLVRALPLDLYDRVRVRANQLDNFRG